MDKWLCWGSMGVAGLLLIAFLLDMIIGMPFGRLNRGVDVLGIIASGVIAYLGWDSYREIR
jgi:hypothetical protein